MNGMSGSLVFWILVPLFAAVGFYLIWYSRRRKKMLEAFAKSHRFSLRPERITALQQTLDRCFSLPDEGLVRSFGQLSSLVDGGPIRLFRTVELLDLNPHAQSYSTNFGRIAALFAIAPDYDEFFVLDRSMQARQRLPASKSPDPEVVEVSKRITASCKARHALSVSLTSGYGLIYFEPLVTGSETRDDIDSLYRIAKNLHETFSADRGK